MPSFYMCYLDPSFQSCKFKSNPLENGNLVNQTGPGKDKHMESKIILKMQKGIVKDEHAHYGIYRTSKIMTAC